MKHENNDRIAWHPAFFEAIQMELEEYSHNLQFISEYQLNTEPLRIDVVIIKKTKDIPIKKSIASIFRKVNILEYKSPDDYVSVKDFYLVYAYASLYLALNDLDVNDLTLTFVENRYPRELVNHLTQKRNYCVEEKSPGVYIVTGDILPIQIIDNRRLSASENIWLRDLDNQLDLSEVQRITTQLLRLGKTARIRAYFDVIIRANRENLQGVLKMNDNTGVAFVELLDELGIETPWGVQAAARGKAQAGEEKAREIARNLLAEGSTPEFIQKITGLDLEIIKGLSS